MSMTDESLPAEFVQPFLRHKDDYYSRSLYSLDRDRAMLYVLREVNMHIDDAALREAQRELGLDRKQNPHANEVLRDLHIGKRDALYKKLAFRLLELIDVEPEEA